MKVTDKAHHVMPVHIEVDDYIPLHVMVGHELDRQLYYRYVGDEYLLEIGFNPTEGNLSSVKLVLVEDYSLTEHIQCNIPSHSIEGLPCCECNDWDGVDHIDSNERFIVSISMSQLLIRLGNKVDETAVVYSNENIYIGCSSNKAVQWLFVDGLEESQARKIGNVISSQQEHGFL